LRPAEDIVLAPRHFITPARHARSTVMISTITTLREAGKFDDYMKLLDPAHRDALLQAVAGTWIPMNSVMAHYAACDALDFRHEQQFANGRAVFDKTRGTLLGTVVRMAKEAGVTPWTVLPYFQRFWERGYDGGGVAIWKTGPKEVRLEIVQVPMLDSTYYRNALRGLVTAVIELFCRKAYVVERPGVRAHGATVMRAQWA
jgi:hypothetical protein